MAKIFVEKSGLVTIGKQVTFERVFKCDVITPGSFRFGRVTADIADVKIEQPIVIEIKKYNSR